MKNKILKTCFVGCLATCLTLTGIFAFAPLGVSAQTNQNTNLNSTNSFAGGTSTTESAGLITPRADDPVLFTTESGLEIKYGNINGTISSGGLKGLPYFRTTNGLNNYDWVILASRYSDIYMNCNDVVEQNIVTDYKSVLSQWLNTDFEYNVLHDEIPQGYWLVWLNSYIVSPSYTNYYHTVYAETCNAYYAQLFETDFFNFGAGLSSIYEPTLSHIVCDSNRNPTVTNYITAHFFSLDYPDVGTSFMVSTYLKHSSLYVSSSVSWACRSMNGYGRTAAIASDGSISWFSTMNNTTTFNLRPACLISPIVFT